MVTDIFVYWSTDEINPLASSAWRRYLRLVPQILGYASSSGKQTVLAHFFTCNFLIYKKRYPQTLKIFTHTPNTPYDPLKNNYIYNHVKKYTYKSKSTNIITFHTKN